MQYLELDYESRSQDAPPVQLRLPIDLEDVVIDNGAGLTDRDMNAFITLNRLQRLDLFLCDNVSGAGLQRLKAL